MSAQQACVRARALLKRIPLTTCLSPALQTRMRRAHAVRSWDRALCLPAGAVARLRVLLRLDMIEAYVDDVFLATFSPASWPTE